MSMKIGHLPACTPPCAERVFRCRFNAGPSYRSPVHLDAVMLDGAPGHLQELVGKITTGGQEQPTGLGQADLEEFRGAERRARYLGDAQPGVLGAVIPRPDPLPDALFQFGHVEERLILNVLAPVVYVRALVRGQVLQQAEVSPVGARIEARTAVVKGL